MVHAVLTQSAAAVPPSPSAISPLHRDGLGWACFALHIAILIYIFVGWLIAGQLGFYLIFLPAMALHWRLNASTCAINNLETLIRTGHWRDPQSPDEGAWVNNLIAAATGITLTKLQNNLLSHGLLAVLWGLAFWHRAGW
jgi:hypothetical protein